MWVLVVTITLCVLNCNVTYTYKYPTLFSCQRAGMFATVGTGDSFNCYRITDAASDNLQIRNKTEN